jgi:DNA polymerase V
VKASKPIDIRTQYRFESFLVDTKISKEDTLEAGHKSDIQLLDLNKFMDINSDDTYLVRVSGESMIDENIFNGDMLVVNRLEQPTSGTVVIASVNGEMAVKKFVVENGNVYLVSANKKFLPIRIMPFWEFHIHGVVKYVIRNF